MHRLNSCSPQLDALSIVCMLSVFMVLLAGCSPAAGTTGAEPSRDSASPQAWPQVQVVAHRGGAALAPENTLGAFANALRIGVDMVECDVHLSADGQVVIMHDPDVSRTTDGSGMIYQAPLVELQKLNAAADFSGGAWPAEPVPTLAELLDLVKGKAQVQIEIKVATAVGRYPGIEQKVIDLVKARDMVEDVLIISFDFPTLVEVRKLDPGFKTGALVNSAWMAANSYKDYERIVSDVIQETGADYFMPASAAVSAPLVSAAHAQGLKMGVWTVNTAGEMQRMAEWGVDAITTDKPDELKQVLGK